MTIVTATETSERDNEYGPSARYPKEIMVGFPNVNSHALRELPLESNQQIATIWRIGCHIFGMTQPTDAVVEAANLEATQAGLQAVVQWWGQQQVLTVPPHPVVRSVEVTGSDMLKVFSCTWMPPMPAGAEVFSHSLEDVLFVFLAGGPGCLPTLQFFHAPSNMMFPSKQGTQCVFTQSLVNDANDLINFVLQHGDNGHLRTDLQVLCDNGAMDINRRITTGCVRQTARDNPGGKRHTNIPFTIKRMWAVTMHDNNALLNKLANVLPDLHPLN